MKCSRNIQFALLLVPVFWMSCSKNTKPQNQPPQQVWDKDYLDTVDFDIVQSTSEFAINLYHTLPVIENQLISPLSISYALALAYNGARLETKREMADALRFSYDLNQVNEGFKALSSGFNKSDENTTLRIANAVWAQKDFNFSVPFIENCKKYYQGGFKYTDFVSQPEASGDEINKWVSDITENRINDLLSSEDINSSVRMILVNALYFKSAWMYPFAASSTTEAPFFPGNGKETKVKMMNLNDGHFLYFENDSFQMLALPYLGKEYSMYVILPANKIGYKGVEAQLSYPYLKNLELKMQKTAIDLFFPRFGFSSSVQLSENLKKMGMVEAFGDNADFSGMTGRKDLFISKVIHKTFIAVDENGTEAAAATAVVMVERAAMPVDRIVFKADHPFFFYIKNNQTGAILFIGRLVNPDEK